MWTVTIATAILAASLATAITPTVAGSRSGGCDLDIHADPAHGAHGELNPWTTHAHPRWTWDATCPGYPTVEAFVIYPSWGGAFTTTNGSFHAADAPDGVLSIEIVGVWSRTTADGDVRYVVTDATESPRVGVDAGKPVIDPVVARGAHSVRDGVTWLNERAVIDSGFEDDVSGISGRAVRAVDGDWMIPREDGFRLGGEDGARTLQFIATDRAGNLATHEARFGLDTTAPEVTVHAPAATWGEGVVDVTRPFEVEVTVEDAGAGVQSVAVFVDGEPVRLAMPDAPAEAFTTTMRVPAHMVEPGTHAFTVRAMDAVGNEVESSPVTVLAR